MSRIIETPENGGTARRIEQAALDLFFERGFPATTMREIGMACGLTAGALYNHFASKEYLLASIIGRVHEELERMLREALERAGDDPRARLRELTRTQALFHTNHTKEARVANQEVLWLPEPDRSTIIRVRRMTRRWWEDAINDGIAAGIFTVDNANATVKAILYAGIGIGDWFRTGGPMSAEQVADLHAQLALRMAGDRS